MQRPRAMPSVMYRAAVRMRMQNKRDTFSPVAATFQEFKLVRTGDSDVAERSLPDARHWHRPRKDPGLGAGRGGPGLQLHRGRRPRFWRGDARRLETELQRE